jgi:hypothetical protein
MKTTGKTKRVKPRWLCDSTGKRLGLILPPYCG